MTKPSHVFIVGSYRTGTTLLRHTLNCSPDVAICGETHFFGQLVGPGFRQEFARIGDIATEAGARKVVDYIYTIQSTSFWRWVQRNVDREQFLQELLASDRTDRALFDLVMALYADGKPIRGEKTPAHVHYVPTLLEWFPQAKIIHTFRDPRAIFVSKAKKKGKQEDVPRHYSLLRQSMLILEMYLSLNVLISWLRIVQLHHRYQQLYPDNYYLSRYEDLITDPQIHLKKLCDFLEIDFTEAMLEQSVINSSFGSRQDQTRGFSTSAIDRWRNHMHPVINKWFVLWCKKHLLEFGYQL